MRHTVDSIAFAQGWLGNQLNEAAKDISEEEQVKAGQILDQWKVLDESVDDLLRENRIMFEKLKAIAIENITK